MVLESPGFPVKCHGELDGVCVWWLSCAWRGWLFCSGKLAYAHKQQFYRTPPAQFSRAVSQAEHPPPPCMVPPACTTNNQYSLELFWDSGLARTKSVRLSYAIKNCTYFRHPAAAVPEMSSMCVLQVGHRIWLSVCEKGISKRRRFLVFFSFLYGVSEKI